jgi:Altronate dehydratase
MNNKKDLLIVAQGDSVAVALRDLTAGEEASFGGGTIVLKEDIPFGHKVALADIKEGQNIIKYGFPIGHALKDIPAGSHIHTDNLKTNLSGVIEYKYSKTQNVIKAAKPETFMGYKRKSGRAGVRNEVWIIPTVGCVNSTAQILAKEANRAFAGQTDGFFAYTHNMGCSQLGDDMKTTQKILKGLINNPNAGAVLVLSLGCENNNLDVFKPLLGDYDPDRVKFLVTQNIEDEYDAGLKILGELASYAASFKREPVPVSDLVIGFKCGGSDGLSGISANPLCGRINDMLVARGGSTILTEVPEMFGAETILMNRAEDEKVFEKIVALINNFKEYFIRHKQVIYENPSPGNKKGGISSMEDKSLGCIQKGGKAQVADVLDFGQSVSRNGLNLLTGPGNDQVSCTNLTAAGAQIILFTTGRGNPFGAPVPTLKISSNTPLYERKTNWIDYNAGQIIDGKSFEDAASELYALVLNVASGRVQTKNEIYGYREISVFRDGVIL